MIDFKEGTLGICRIRVLKLVCTSALEEKEKHHCLDDKVTQGQDGSFLSLGNLKERFRQIRRSARFTHHPTTKRPGRLKIVSHRSGRFKIVSQSPGRLKIVSQGLVKACFLGLNFMEP